MSIPFVGPPPHVSFAEYLNKLQVVKSGRLPIPKLDLSSIAEAVTQLRTLETRWPRPPPVPEVTESNRKFTTRDGAELDLFVFQPASPTWEPIPLVIFFHGGGGVIGTAYSVAPLARELVLAHGCVVISPQYRLAPDYVFPTGANDGWDAFVYISTRASDFSADASAGLIVGGVSHGAVLTSLIALQAKETSHSPQISGLYYSAGAFIANPETIPDQYRTQYLSRTDERCINAPILNADTKTLFDRAYNADVSSPLYRAFNTEPLSKHAHVAPKAYFQVCGSDILRDDGLIYEQVLKERGVETLLDVYPGTPHIFWSVFRTIKQAAKWKADTNKGVGWLLGRESDKDERKL
ncbi:hypothetical protein A1O3_10122 [Capronia epimyces CBS 606.96]|uniref:Alpha/beta hydrolase fold-3 domain-containing protein n=1 Tax=Capronia epimyces CBS 606.96 TaxID=1182542 RepID=W9XHZ7_9EURO|nr:uncharacterized protein A1O3_10122 [Capronia epimyces CBS 606.96]EXJ76965.1 hypothetical protein A1O3_10122 [Capronia epimyces CBS 606.96]